MDTSFYYNSDAYSDCTILYVVSHVGGQDDAAPAPQQDHHPSPGHRIVLSCASERFRAEIDRWQFDQSDHSIHLTLAPAELEPARVMMKYAYNQQLPEHYKQDQLIQLHDLADRYQVMRCRQACRAALLNMPADDITWDTVLWWCHGGWKDWTDDEKPAVECFVRDTIVPRLGHELGDLEVVLNSEEIQGTLFALPVGWLFVLLTNACKVAYESTAFAAATQWIDAQPAGSLTPADLVSLSACMRPLLLQRSFSTTIIPHIKWYVDSVPPLLLNQLLTVLHLPVVDKTFVLAQMGLSSQKQRLGSSMQKLDVAVEICASQV